MADVRNLSMMSAAFADLQINSEAHATPETVCLLVEGRLLRDCISTVLQKKDRVIQSDCVNLAELSERIEILAEPDLVIISIANEEISPAFAAIRAIRAHWPRARWIVLSRVADRNFIRDGLKSGVDGFLLQDSPVEVLRLVTDLVLLGHAPLPADIARLLADEPVSSPSAEIEPATPIVTRPIEQTCETPTPTPPIGPIPPIGQRSRSLSERELDILRCLSHGMSNKVIARELLIAEATVKAHVKALLRKMQVSNRTQAAIRATQMPGAVMPRSPASCARDEPAPAQSCIPAISAVVRHAGLQAAYGL